MVPRGIFREATPVMGGTSSSKTRFRETSSVVRTNNVCLRLLGLIYFSLRTDLSRASVDEMDSDFLGEFFQKSGNHEQFLMLIYSSENQNCFEGDAANCREALSLLSRAEDLIADQPSGEMVPMGKIGVDSEEGKHFAAKEGVVFKSAADKLPQLRFYYWKKGMPKVSFEEIAIPLPMEQETRSAEENAVTLVTRINSAHAKVGIPRPALVVPPTFRKTQAIAGEKSSSSKKKNKKRIDAPQVDQLQFGPSIKISQSGADL